MSKLDLGSAYNRLQIVPCDEWKTAFSTNWRLFEYLVILFDLTNAPANYQRFINSILAEQLDQPVIVYLDAILIYSKDQATNNDDVPWVLSKLQVN